MNSFKINHNLASSVTSVKNNKINAGNSTGSYINKKETKMVSNTNVNDIRQLFKVCDLDGSGDIDRHELAQICPHLSQDEIDSVFKDLDKNNDGLISFNEFCQGFKELIPINYYTNTNNNDFNEFINDISSPNHMQSKFLKNFIHDNESTIETNKVVDNCDNNSRNSSVSKENDNVFYYLDHGFKLLSCQELICDFYQTFSQENPDNIGLFEKILYSVIEDVQKYQKEIQRLENSYRKEKEQNEKFLKQIEEEAENQLQITTDRIKQEERHKWELEREQLKTTFRNEIADLQANLTQMESIEQKYINNKNDDDSQVLSLKTELNDLIVENRHLKSTLTESQTQLAVLRSEMATLKAQYEERNHDYEHEKRCTSELGRELDNLKQQVHILHEANKRLHDTNDDLRAHMETFKAKALRVSDREVNKTPQLGSSPKTRKDSVLASYIANTEKLLQQARNKSSNCLGITSISGLNNYNNNHIVANRSFDAESINEDIDSGFSTINGITECDTDGENLQVSLNKTKYKNSLNDTFGSLNTTVLRDNNSACDEDVVFEEEFYDENGQKVIRRRISNRSNGTFSPILSLQNNKILTNAVDSTDSSLPKSPTGPPDRMFKVVFAGDAAVGKSSFIMRFCKGKFLANLNSTLGVDFQMKLIDVDGKTTAIQLWDTCGQERFRAIAKSYFRRADGVVLMYDCTYERSFLNVREWISTIQDSTDKKLPVILVSNKIDLREQAREDGKKVIEYDDGLRLAKEYEALFIETSAKDGTNIHESLVEIARIMRCNEDIEVKSSGIKLTWNEKKKTCCWSS